MLHFLITVLLSSAGFAQEPTVATPDLNEQIKAEVALQLKTLQDQEKEKNKETPPKFFGDFRYRHQGETDASAKERRIHRLQARLGLTATLQENLKLTFRLMTGTDAVSGNQTLGDPKAPGSPRRNFGVDQAYFDYQPFTAWTLWGGRLPQPFTFVGKHQIVLDADLALEGLGTRVKVPLSENVDLFAQGGSFWIRENFDETFKEDATDTFFNAGQLGLAAKWDDWQATVGTGIYSFTAMKDQPATNYTTLDKVRGNTLDLTNNYPTNFDTEENFAELKYKQEKWELGLFYTQLKNRDAADLNKATAYGYFGSYGNLGFSWTQREVQKDAVLALFADSDFAGGRTSSKGQIASLFYKLTKKVQVTYTNFTNQYAIETATPQDYKRHHLDLSMSF